QNLMPVMFEQSLSRTFAMSHPIDYEPTLDQSMIALAAVDGRDVFEYFYDYLLQDGGTSVAIKLGFNYADGDLEACRTMIRDPFTVTGLSDAGAHVNFNCDMGIPTFNLTHWARDRARGDRLPIQLVVTKNTGRVAHVFGLRDRGSLEISKRA